MAGLTPDRETELSRGAAARRFLPGTGPGTRGASRCEGEEPRDETPSSLWPAPGSTVFAGFLSVLPTLRRLGAGAGAGALVAAARVQAGLRTERGAARWAAGFGEAAGRASPVEAAVVLKAAVLAPAPAPTPPRCAAGDGLALHWFLAAPSLAACSARFWRARARAPAAGMGGTTETRGSVPADHSAWPSSTRSAESKPSEVHDKLAPSAVDRRG